MLAGGGATAHGPDDAHPPRPGLPAPPPPGDVERGPAAAPRFDYEPPAPGTYELPPIAPAPPLAAVDAATGRTVQLADLRGSALLVTFVYLACPDPAMCPLAIATTARVYRTIRERGLGGRARFVVVTIDPVHDTPDALRTYATETGTAGPGWLWLRPGGTAATASLLAAWDLHPRAAPDGSLTHILRTYLVDPEGLVRQIYLPSWFDPRVVANDLLTVLGGAAARAVTPAPSGSTHAP